MLELLFIASLAFAEEAPPLVDAIQLPVAAERARAAGYTKKDVDEVLASAKSHKLGAGGAAEQLDDAGEAAEKHGPVDNLGAFVKAQLDDGKRGKDLAAAIHAQHEAHGKGKPEGKGKPDGKGQPEGKGKPDGKGQPAGKGKPDAAAKGDGQGGKRPDGAGAKGGKQGKGGQQ